MQSLLGLKEQTCQNGPGHMTNTAAMSVNDKKKTIQIFFSGTYGPNGLKLNVLHRVFELYQDRSYNDPKSAVTCLRQE